MVLFVKPRCLSRLCKKEKESMPLMSSRSLIAYFKVQLDKKAAALLSFCNNMKIWFFTFMVLFDTLKYHLWYFTIISIVLGIYEKNARE